MTRNKGVTIAALVIAIVGLSIGFAAFSNTLTIKSSASVTPDDSNFQVKFSKVSNQDQTGPSYKITPTLTHTGEAYANGSYNATNFTASDGEIDSTNPLLFKDLQAHFTEPGQTVTYHLYVRNTGSYTAYLTNLDFKDIAGGNDFIDCTGNVTSGLLSAVCGDITVSVTIGEDTYTSRDQELSNEISQVSLASGASEEVTVVISYANNGNYPDGPVTVEFGDIMLEYRSVDTPLAIPDPVLEDDSCAVTNVKSFGACTYTDLDTSGGISTGDKVTCGTEGFYVIKAPSNGVVTMLSEWNLNVSEPGDIDELEGIPYSYTYCESTAGYQDSHVRGYVNTASDSSLIAYTTPITFTVEEFEMVDYPWPYGVVEFDRVTQGDHGYWVTGNNNELNTGAYVACTGQSYCDSYGYPAYVYDNNATLKPFVDTYVGYLNSAISGANAQGRLMRYDELEALGCSGNKGVNGSCSSAPSWVYQTSYWTGSAWSDLSVWYVSTRDKFAVSRFDSQGDGVRPVIEISSGVISLAS